jgi:putative sigma-54 modulation protein
MTASRHFTTSYREAGISVASRRLPLDGGLRQAVPRILSAALSQFAHRFRSVHVWLEDVNGPRGGVDIRCRIELGLHPRGRIVVSSMAANSYVSLANAAARAGSVLSRRVKRARARRRSYAES